MRKGAWENYKRRQTDNLKLANLCWGIKFEKCHKGGFQKLLSGFFPLRGGYPPIPLSFFGHNDFPLRGGGVPPNFIKGKIC